MKSRRWAAVAAAFAAFLLSQAVRGDSLADRAPADAIGFVSWAGSDALGNSYNNSHFKGLIDTFNVPGLISQAMEKEAAKNADDPDKQAAQKMVQEWIAAMIKAPTAIYFGPVDFADASKPGFKIAIYSQVGKEKAAKFAAEMTAQMAKAPKGEKDPPTAAVPAGDYILITIGNVPGFEKRLDGPAPADGLANVPAFQQTMTQIGAATAPSAALVYINGQAAVKTIQEGVEASGGPAAGMWPNIADATGLSALRNIGFAGNFDGPNWTSQMFVGLDAKRPGFTALFDAKPLGDDIIKLVPKSASWASVIRVDAPRAMQDIRDAVTQLNPGGARGFDEGLRQFFAFTGVDLQKDIVDTLGDSFVIFGTPDAKGETFKNATLVSKPKDAQKLETAFTTLESVMSAMMGQRGVNAVNFKTETLPPPNDKVTVHIISSDQISPAWAVHDGVLYVSLSLDGIKSAIENNAKNAPIVENPQFGELWKKVGTKEMSAYSFIDYPKLAAELHPLIVKALEQRKAAMPNEKDPFVLPSLEKITAQLGPALSVYWSDKDGYHVKSTGPVPGSDWIRPESILQLGMTLGLKVRSGEAAMP